MFFLLVHSELVGMIQLETRERPDVYMQFLANRPLLDSIANIETQNNVNVTVFTHKKLLIETMIEEIQM